MRFRLERNSDSQIAATYFTVGLIVGLLIALVVVAYSA